MSAQGAGTLATQRDKIVEIIGALSAPVIITFLLYITGTSSGATFVSPVGYFIAGAPGVSVPGGVTCIFSSVATSCTGLQAPSFLISIFNSIIFLVVLIVVLVQGAKLAGSALESRRD